MTHHEEVLGSNPPSGLFVWALHVFTMSVSGYSDIFLQPKDNAISGVRLMSWRCE